MSASDVTGTATLEQKAEAIDLFQNLCGAEGYFAAEVSRRIKVISLDFDERKEDEYGAKKVAKLVCEIEVMKDMCHLGNNMQGGCGAFLLDICTSIGHAVFDFKLLSLAININYHSPAPLGTTLRIVSTIVAVGKRVITTRCEIHDRETRNIVISGTQLKMFPREDVTPWKGLAAKSQL